MPYKRLGTPNFDEWQKANLRTAAARAASKSHRNSSRLTSLEKVVAFFGAVDTRPHLFMLSVALESVQRFHPAAGYFALIPSEHSCSEYPCASAGKNGDLWCGQHFRRYCPLLQLWSRGTVRPLSLPREVEQLFPTNSTNASAFVYSRMTFLRHFVPQALALKGYQFSVNIDPDTFCVRSWDLRLMLRIELLGGRPVGTNTRTQRFLQLGGQSTNASDTLQRALNVSRERLMRQRTEFNGGVLVFNNTEAARVGWGQTVARYYGRLRHLIESDQDLISLLLVAEPSFGRYFLPTVYNYAFRRDRERLPYAVSHRLRHGLVGHFKSAGTRGEVVMMHFVQDGKPWQRQELAAYPPYLLAARLFHVASWLKLARKVKPELFNDHVRLTLAEKRLLGGAAAGAFRQGRKNKARAFSAIVDAESSRRCRCFVRGLARDAKANISNDAGRRQTTRLQHAAARSNASVAGSASTREANAASRAWQALLEACCSDRCNNTVSSDCKCSESQLSAPAEEATQCEAERGSNAKRFNCRLAAKRAGDGESWAPSNCTAGAVSFGVSGVATVGQMAMRSRIYYCRDCISLSPPAVFVATGSAVAVKATREAERGANAKRFGCRLAAKRAGNGKKWAPSNCTTDAVRFGVSGVAAVGQMAMRSRIYYCRECLSISLDATSAT